MFFSVDYTIPLECDVDIATGKRFVKFNSSDDSKFVVATDTESVSSILGYMREDSADAGDVINIVVRGRIDKNELSSTHQSNFYDDETKRTNLAKAGIELVDQKGITE